MDVQPCPTARIPQVVCESHAERCTAPALDSTVPDAATFLTSARLAPRRVPVYHRHMAATSSGNESLPRRLGLFGAITVVVGITIGSGIFRSPAGIANRLPGPGAMLAVWVVGGLLAMCGALALAEVASAFPKTGGIYVFLREGWGKLPAFLFGWAELVIIRAAAVGAIAITFAEYFLRVLGYNPLVAPYDTYARYTAAAAIILTSAFNIVGIRWSALVTGVTTLAKYGGLLFVILLAFVDRASENGRTLHAVLPAGTFSVAPFGLALVSVLWAFDGWADLTFAGGEVKDGERNLPRAIILGSLAVLVDLPAREPRVPGGPPGRADPNVEARCGGRGRARDGGGRRHVRRGHRHAVDVRHRSTRPCSRIRACSSRWRRMAASSGPWPRCIRGSRRRYNAIALAAALGVTFVLLRKFEDLADAFVTAILPFYILGVAAIFVLRRRPGYAPAFRSPGYPIVPIVVHPGDAVSARERRH